MKKFCLALMCVVLFQTIQADITPRQSSPISVDLQSLFGSLSSVVFQTIDQASAQGATPATQRSLLTIAGIACSLLSQLSCEVDREVMGTYLMRLSRILYRLIQNTPALKEIVEADDMVGFVMSIADDDERENALYFYLEQINFEDVLSRISSVLGLYLEQPVDFSASPAIRGKKVAASTFFFALSAAAREAGNAANAERKQDRDQAMCNIFSIAFEVAGHAIQADEAPDKKEEPSKNCDVVNKSPEVVGVEVLYEFVCESLDDLREFFIKRTRKHVYGIVDEDPYAYGVFRAKTKTLDADQIDSAKKEHIVAGIKNLSGFLCDSCGMRDSQDASWSLLNHIPQIISTPCRINRNAMVEEWLSSPEDGQAFIEELFFCAYDHTISLIAESLENLKDQPYGD